MSVVDPGSYEVMSVFTSTADDSCVLRVTLPSGAISVARGLGAKRADQTGSVTWRWRIGTRTSPGTARVTVGCGAGSVSGSFVIS